MIFLITSGSSELHDRFRIPVYGIGSRGLPETFKRIYQGTGISSMKDLVWIPDSGIICHSGPMHVDGLSVVCDREIQHL